MHRFTIAVTRHVTIDPTYVVAASVELVHVALFGNSRGDVERA